MFPSCSLLVCPVIYVAREVAKLQLGLPSIDKTSHSKFLSNEFDGLYLSLSDILLQKSSDAADPEADFAALYLAKGLDTSPVGYMTDLFREKIDEGAQLGKRCIVVDGFPRNAKQCRAFAEKVRNEPLKLETY